MRARTVDPKSHVTVVAQDPKLRGEVILFQPAIKRDAGVTAQFLTVGITIPVDMVNAKELVLVFVTAMAKFTVGIKHFFSKFVSSSFGFRALVGTIRRILSFYFVRALTINIGTLFAPSADAAGATKSRSKCADLFSFFTHRACFVGQRLVRAAKFPFLIVLPAITKGAVLAMTVKPILVVGIRSKLIHRLCLFTQSALFTHLNTIISYTGITVQSVSKITVR